MRRWLGFGFVLVAAVALAACSGGDDDEENDGGGDASATPTATASGGVAVTSEPAATVGTPSPEDEFAVVLSRLGDSEFRITYTFTSTVGGQEFTGELTWIRAKDGRQRFETSTEQADQAVTLTLIDDAAGGRISCFEVGGLASCFGGEDGPSSEIPNPTEAIFDNVLDPDRISGVRETETREIAGIEATCYEVDAGEGTSEACIGEGNFLLSASWTAPSGDGGGFEASEFSTDVNDEDFEPAGPIVG